MRALTLAFGWVLVLGNPFVAAQSHTPEVPAHAAETKSPTPHGPLTTPPSRPTSAQTAAPAPSSTPVKASADQCAAVTRHARRTATESGDGGSEARSRCQRGQAS